MKHTIENGVIRFVSDSFNIEPWYLGFVDEDVNYFWLDYPQGVDTIVKHNAPRSEIEACWSPDGKGFRLTPRAFHEGCFCVHPVTCGALTLKGRNSLRSLRMDVQECTHLQFWAPPTTLIFA